MTTGKSIALPVWTFAGNVMYLLFHMLHRIVIAFLPRNKCLLISWLQPPSAVILEPKKIKSVTGSTFSLPICHEMMRPDAWAQLFVFFLSWFSNQLFHHPHHPQLFSSSLLSAIRMVSSAYLRWFSSSYLDSSLWVIQPSILHDVLYI